MAIEPEHSRRDLPPRLLQVPSLLPPELFLVENGLGMPCEMTSEILAVLRQDRFSDAVFVATPDQGTRE
jgi:hypothetical protein